MRRRPAVYALRPQTGAENIVNSSASAHIRKRSRSEIGKCRYIGETTEEKIHLRAGEQTAVAVFKYKPVAKKVRPHEGDVPERCRVKRRKHPHPLAGIPQMPLHPPDFEPSGRLTRERYLEIPWNPDGFLWEDEVKLLVWIIGQASGALSWEVQ